MKKIKGMHYQMIIDITLLPKDVELLEAWGFDFEKNVEIMTEQLIRNASNQIRFERDKEAKPYFPEEGE